MGAGLPAMAIVQTLHYRMGWPHRWQASSHMDLQQTRILHTPQPPVGVSLLAMASVGLKTGKRSIPPITPHAAWC
ncbi:hypothetical protein EMIT0P395_90204 [Pseudomonas sp. IT-P395]